MKSSLIAIATVFDLGFDVWLIYKIDPAIGKMTPNEPDLAQTPAGAGSRHLAFHPSGQFVFVNKEDGSSQQHLRALLGGEVRSSKASSN